MNKLRFHFVIVALCCFSFLLLAGTHVFRKAKSDFDVYIKPVVEVEDYRKDRLMKVVDLKKTSNRKNEVSAVKNGRIK